MVRNVMSLTRNGLLDWLIQRVSALLIGAYGVFLIAYLVCHPQLNFADWQALFANNFMRIFSFLVLLSILAHTWVGMWTVFTDYIKPVCIRFIVEIATIVLLLAYVAWGIAILWK